MPFSYFLHLNKFLTLEVNIFAKLFTVIGDRGMKTVRGFTWKNLPSKGFIMLNIKWFNVLNSAIPECILQPFQSPTAFTNIFTVIKCEWGGRKEVYFSALDTYCSIYKICFYRGRIFRLVLILLGFLFPFLNLQLGKIGG